jgi:hypothetical protein
MTRFLAGNPGFFDIAPDDLTMGEISPPNLTPDPATGLGNWTDEQIRAAFASMDPMATGKGPET